MSKSQKLKKRREGKKVLTLDKVEKLNSNLPNSHKEIIEEKNVYFCYSATDFFSNGCIFRDNHVFLYSMKDYISTKGYGNVDTKDHCHADLIRLLDFQFTSYFSLMCRKDIRNLSFCKIYYQLNCGCVNRVCSSLYPAGNSPVPFCI